jgi:hypothetical protein
MKFKLEISLGNDAMKSSEDIIGALKYVEAKLQRNSEGKILDLNGNSVGKWEFVEEKEKKYHAIVTRNKHRVVLGEATEKEKEKEILVKLDCFPTDGCFVLKEQE